MTGVKSKRGKAPQSSVDFSLDNTPQSNGMSCLSTPPLNLGLKSCLYTSYKIVARLNSLAQAAAETEKNYHGQIENAVPVDATLIEESQSTNTIDRDNSTDYASTSPVLAGMEVVRKSSGFFSKFD